MATKLDRIVAMLAPEKTVEPITAAIEAACASFHELPVHPETWGRQEVESYLGQFFLHVCIQLDRALVEYKPAYAWGLYAYLYLDVYPNWLDNLGIRMIRTGTGGGLLAVLRSLTRHWAAHDSRSIIWGIVQDHFDVLSWEEQKAAEREYMTKWSHIVPAEMNGGTYLRSSFPNALRDFLRDHHAYILRDMRKIATTAAALSIGSPG